MASNRLIGKPRLPKNEAAICSAGILAGNNGRNLGVCFFWP
jgi:hypothetical protein